MSTHTLSMPRDRDRTLSSALPSWWWFLITGIAWILVSLVILRFDYTSVTSISILFGVVAIMAGVFEVGLAAVTHGWWRALNILGAVVFIASGVVSFVHPGDTFVALAGVFSFFLVLAGTFDIISAISARNEISVWWVTLIGGIIEVLLGFWAAGYWGRSATLLVAWVGAYTLIRGVRDIVFAFRVREFAHAVEGGA